MSWRSFLLVAIPVLAGLFTFVNTGSQLFGWLAFAAGFGVAFLLTGIGRSKAPS